MRELNTIKLSIIKVIYRNRVLRIALAIFCTFAGFQDSLCAQSSNSALARLAANLQPGSWAELETHGMTKELIASNGSYRTILEYADKAVWDSDSETLFFVGEVIMLVWSLFLITRKQIRGSIWMIHIGFRALRFVMHIMRLRLM